MEVWVIGTREVPVIHLSSLQCVVVMVVVERAEEARGGVNDSEDERYLLSVVEYEIEIVVEAELVTVESRVDAVETEVKVVEVETFETEVKVVEVVVAGVEVVVVEVETRSDSDLVVERDIVGEVEEVEGKYEVDIVHLPPSQCVVVLVTIDSVEMAFESVD